MYQNLLIPIGILLLCSDTVVIPISAALVPSNVKDCYANDTDPYLLFASKTSYFTVDNEIAEPIQIEGCSAKSYWLLARHGSRNPGDEDIAKMLSRGPELRDLVLKNHEEGRGKLCEKDISGIDSWTFDLSVEDDSLLTESGKLEHVQFGQRMKKRLPTLLGGSYNPEEITFRTTIKERAIESGKAFAKGVFPNDNVDLPPPLEEDRLLRYYEFCPRWIEGVDENPNTFNERNLFALSEVAKETIMRVNERLGFEMEAESEEEEENAEIEEIEAIYEVPEEQTDDNLEIYNETETNTTREKRETSSELLSFDDVVLIFDMCRYEKAWNPTEISPWCAAFKEEDLKVLEYYEELEYWYKDGYYYDINTKFACPLMKDLVMQFQGDISKSKSNLTANETENDVHKAPNATLYFSHSEAVLPFISLLGLNIDDFILTHDSYEQAQNRKYRVSYMDPFASNVGFLLLDCVEEPMERIMLLHQERPVKLPKCDREDCDWQKFKEIYADDIDCQFEEICQDNNGALTKLSFLNENSSGRTSPYFNQKTIALFLLTYLLF